MGQSDENHEVSFNNFQQRLRNMTSPLVRMSGTNGNLYLLTYCSVKALHLESISFLDVDSKTPFLG